MDTFKKNIKHSTPSILKLILNIQNYRQSFTNKIPAMDKKPETIRKAAQALVKRGHISKQGTTRGVFYTLHK